jgi:hypothetical protein
MGINKKALGNELPGKHATGGNMTKKLWGIVILMCLTLAATRKWK